MYVRLIPLADCNLVLRLPVVKTVVSISTVVADVGRICKPVPAVNVPVVNTESSTFTVTAPVVPPPFKPVPAVPAVMSPAPPPPPAIPLRLD